MITLNFTNLLFVIIFFNLLFVALVAFTYKTGRPIANKLFALFLLAKALCFTSDFFGANYSFSADRFIHVFFLGLSFDLLLGPILLFYIKSLTRENICFRRKDILHIIPFAGHVLYMAIIFYSESAGEKQELIESGRIFTPSFILINFAAIYCSFICYAIAGITELAKYQRNMHDYFSNYNERQMKWLCYLLGGMIGIWCMAIISGVLRLFSVGFAPDIALYIIPIFIFSNMIFYFGIKHANIYGGIAPTKEKYEKSKIPEKVKEQLLQKLVTYCELEKPYLQPDLSIKQLSEQTSIPASQISQLVNGGLNRNFHEFINYFRVKESIAMFSNPEYKKHTVLEILYSAGFNSKSVFNSAFKKQTGVTPTQFKKQPESAQLQQLLP